MREPLYSADEMRAAEAAYPGFPATAPELMERAGAAVAAEALRRFPDARRFAVVCGSGSNGGDGRIAAQLLGTAGRTAEVTNELGAADVVIDALFGTGFIGPPRAPAAALIEKINANLVPVLAVDLPSGVDASTGEVATVAVRATATVTFHRRKAGHLIAPGRFHAGEVVVAEIGLDDVPTRMARPLPTLLDKVPRRAETSSKYTAGALLVLGGSLGLTGAACLTARAALRADAGYVLLAVPADCVATAETLALEPVKLGLSPDGALDQLMTAAERMSALAVGPGLGRDAGSRKLVRDLLTSSELPAVVDADALHELEPIEREADTILTPHAGELGRLLGRDSAWVAAHRLAAAREAAKRFGAVVLLKGPDTIVACRDGVDVCDLGPPSLATAGTGDVLTGIIGAFLAKGLTARDAAAAAATAHALAAGAVEHQVGMIASDVVAALPGALSS